MVESRGGRWARRQAPTLVMLTPCCWCTVAKSAPPAAAQPAQPATADGCTWASVAGAAGAGSA